MRTANWMGRPELGLDHKELNAIIMPGSHDAGLYLISASGSLMAKAVKPDVFITQDLNIWDQLRAGSRFFDLRVAEFGTGILSSELRLVHAFEPPLMRGSGYFGKFGERIEAVLYQVRQFMESEEAKTGGVNKEVVILRFAHLTEPVRKKLIPLISDFLQYAHREEHYTSWMGREQPTQYKPYMQRDLRFCSPEPVNLAECQISALQGKVLVVIEGLTAYEEAMLAPKGIFVYEKYTAETPAVRTISAPKKQFWRKRGSYTELCNQTGLPICGHFSNTTEFERLKTSQLEIMHQHTTTHMADHLCQIYWTHTDNSLFSRGVRRVSESIMTDLASSRAETALDTLIATAGGHPNIILLDFISSGRSEQVIKHNIPTRTRSCMVLGACSAI
ncbi:MAG: hypothetical protein A3J38_10280 [Gammaproteobacteria bacterium RIFCSPHIGHO2_12_FULL_45_9]|nr:MAG: hypothetical protein A3J38_10280 [Gammaproteobacteria bacterium RIFCSPHIGHO2_12_FULL_45_9]